MSTFSYTGESRAYMHSGGTKYCRLAMITIDNGTKKVHALLTNYGPYKGAAKGGLSGHKPMHGGTSGIEYFDNATSLSSKFNWESIRRRGRGYNEATELREHMDGSDVTELELTNALRATIGMIDAHHSEIMGELYTGATAKASTAKKELSADFAEHIAATKAKLQADRIEQMTGKRPGVKAAKKVATPPPPPVEINRGVEWGSW